MEPAVQVYIHGFAVRQIRIKAGLSDGGEDNRASRPHRGCHPRIQIKTRPRRSRGSGAFGLDRE